MSRKLFRMIFALVFMIGLAMIPASQVARAAGPWYVATTGNDSNNCLSPTTPCATINGAIGKASSGDTLFVAEGTYTGTGDEVVLVDKDITLSGGWDEIFTAQSGISIINGEFTRRGVSVSASTTAYMEYFTIQNGDHTEGKNGISNDGNLTLEKVTITNNGTNTASGFVGGINNSSTGILTLSNSAVINNGSIDNCFGGIWNNSGAELTVVNSTISGNISNKSYCYGAALVGYGTVSLKNATIVENIGDTDIMGAFGTFTLQNSMIGSCGNTTEMTSLGYNIISVNGCPITPMDGDQFGTGSAPINLLIGILQDNGGPTFTHALRNAPPYFVSPAIDSGNPTTPGSDNAACEPIDQRGITRPLDGNEDSASRCDIGAFEYDPSTASSLQTWYVSTNGNDSNDCESISTPCATINGAISKGGVNFGDTVKITTGTYTGSGNEVVYIDKSVYLSGGWDMSFSSQTDITTIDGENTRRGITVSELTNTAIELFQIENGFSEETSGIYTGRGGGIFNDGYLILKECTIKNNMSLGVGGGLYNSFFLKLIESTINGNSAKYYGGGVHSGGAVVLDNTTISGNVSSVYYALGGGIYNHDQGSVSMNNSTIVWNMAGSSGGGIIGGTVVTKNSIIANNYATTSPDCSNTTITSEGYNLVGINTGCNIITTTGDQVGTNTDPVDPHLTQLQDNGGSTFTHALMEGSPAIDAGNPATPGSSGDACLATDQRGIARPQGEACDIGAFELEVANPIIEVPIDIKPKSCPNPLNMKAKGVLPVTIMGLEDFDITQIDPATIRLFRKGVANPIEVAPLRWSLEDAGIPYKPSIGKEGAYDCLEYHPDKYGVFDGYLDLSIKFKVQEVVAAIGEVNHRNVLVLQLSGKLKEEFGGTDFVGEDVVWILKK